MTSPFDRVDLDRLRRRRTVKWSLHGPDVLAAWVAEMDFDVAPAVRAALLDAVEREDFGYAPADTGAVTAACARHLADTLGWEVPATRIFLVADVLTGVAAALDELVAPGSEVIVPTPVYPPLLEVVELGGRRPVEIPLVDRDGRATFDLDTIDAAFRAGAQALLLCSPNNPTGRVFSAEELSALAAIVESHRGRVVSDEVHAPITYPGHPHTPYASISEATAEHAVTVTSASKTWNLAGLKSAQVITSNHADAAHWRKLPVFRVAGPSPLGLATTEAAYRSGGPWAEELVAYLDGNRQLLGDLLAAELPDVSFRAPEGTYLAWLDCSALHLDDPAAFFLHQGRVALSDGPPFGSGAEQHVRINFATSRALLEQIVGAMGAAVHGHRPK